MDKEISSFREGISSYVDTFLNNGPKIAIAIGVFVLFILIGVVLQKVLKRILLKRLSDQLLGIFLSRIALWALILIGFSVFLNIIGWGRMAGGLIAGAGMGAVIIGFAFKDLGENLLSGVFLAFSRPFKIGDIISSNGVVGKVTEVHLRNTHIKTFDGKDTYIPNSMIIKNVLSNHTIDGYMRYDFDINIDYTSDVNSAIESVEQVIKNAPGVLNNSVKQSAVTIVKLESNSITLKVYFWIDTYNADTSVWKIRTQSIISILKSLQEKGITSPGTIIEMRNNMDKPVMVTGKK